MSLAGKNVLVTGGAGFIGSHLVDRLALEGVERLIVVDNLFLGKEANLEAAKAAVPDLRFYQADVSDYETMAEVMVSEDVDVVFDLAVIPLPTSLERPRWTIDVNVAGATVMCELLRQNRYGTLIHFSSSEVYGTAQHVPMDENHPLDAITPYAASKAAADHVVLSYQRTFGVDAAILRPFNAYGPRQNEGAYAGVIPRVISQAVRGELITVFGDGEQTRDFTYVADVAEAAVQVYEHVSTRGRVVNVASGREVSVNLLIQELLRSLGVSVPVVTESARPGDVRRHLGSAALLEQLTGFRPRRALDEGLRETTEWYRAAVSNELHRGRIGTLPPSSLS